LDGATQTLPELYNLYQRKPSDFHDITSGSNGAYSAHTGYDEVTGLGTPVANHLIPDLIGLPVHIVLSGVTEGIPFTNAAVATFVDPTGSQPVGNYTATINWGDGSPAVTGTVVSNGGNSYTVEGSHTYINAGVYAVTVTVQNNTFDLSGVSTAPVNVADAPLSGFAQALSSQTAGFVNNALVAVFSDSDTTLRPVSNYTASIRWFEGNGLSFTSTGTIQNLTNNTFSVFGSTPFAFPSGGLFTVQVTIQDLLGGGTVVVNSVVNVSNNPAIPPLQPQSQTDTGPVNTQYVSMQDALTNLLSAERLFFTALAFGTTPQKLGAFGNLMNALTAYEAAIFAFDMQLPGA
jgi:hypothetical protein